MRKFKINIGCIVILCFISFNVHSQTDDINHKKYWYYRSRLVNDYMKIGPQQGESMPFSHRFEFSNPTGLMGADAVSNLGTYICALATEYYMMRINNQPYNFLDEEIYYALYAFNRLDDRAETEWGYAGTPLNGFFIRNDMPCDFVVNNISHFNFDLQTIPNPPSITYPPVGSPPTGLNGFCSTNFMWGNDEANEAFCAHSQSPSDVSKRNDMAMSVDEVIPILAACALINEFIPQGETFTDNSGSTHFFQTGNADIRDEARNISVRIINYLKKNAGWQIEYPGGALIPISTGGFALGWSFPIAEAVCKINKNNTFVNSHFQCPNYQNANSISTGRALWTAVTNHVYYPVDDATKVAWLEATCNCDYVAIGYNSTSASMLQNANFWHFDWAPMLRWVLHGAPNTSATSAIKQLINDAPSCGPYNLGNGHYPDVKWSTTDNIEHPERRGKNPYASGNPFGTYPGEFNGVDYMLYHNLYYITKDWGNFPYEYDQRAFETPSHLPLSPGHFGSISNPVTFKAFEYISSAALLQNGGNSNNTANVNMRAGKEITLLPGFEVQAGAEYHGYIQRFQCNNGTGDYNRTLADSTKESNDYTAVENFNILPGTSQQTNTYAEQLQQMHQEAASDTLAGLRDIFGMESFEVYPNPNNGKFKMDFTLQEGEKASIYITDIIGNSIFKQEEVEIGSLRINFDMTEQPKGIYFLKFKTSFGRNEVRKISIQ